jgi:hypothetical protein
VEVNVDLRVELGVIMFSPVDVTKGDGVGEKKSEANATRVNARSRGVAVAVSLGTRTISSCVSGLPPAMTTGRLNARIQAPIITSRITKFCAFTLLNLLTTRHKESQILSDHW